MHRLEEHVCALRDGGEVLIRPIRPDDKELLRAGFAALSAQSRYLRFHASIDDLSHEQVRYLTEIDYHDHMAWVALDLEDEARPGMGVARYIRLTEEPHIAEAAVTVIDRYQGRGLGTLLLGFLGRSAIENGIEVFRNYVLVENVGMLGLFDQLGAEKHLEEPGVYRVDMPLAEDPERMPDTPAGRVFREAARKTISPLGSFLPFAWFRRLAGLPELRLDSGSPMAGREAPMLRTHLDQVLEEGEAATEAATGQARGEAGAGAARAEPSTRGAGTEPEGGHAGEPGDADRPPGDG